MQEDSLIAILITVITIFIIIIFENYLLMEFKIQILFRLLGCCLET